MEFSHWLPHAEHRNCARHLYPNWRKTYREKKWQKLFWACAKASSPMLFNLARAKLSQATRDGARDVMKLDPHHWSRAWFRLGSNCDSVDSNICESFNKWIVEPRCHPVINCFETIRKKVYSRIEKQRTDSQNWTGIICPTVMRKLKKSINISAYCHAAWNGDDSYEVTHREDRFKHVEGRPAWPVSGRPRPEPPGEIAMPGRKKKARTREDQEKPRVATRVSRVGTKIKCGVCKQFVHNKTSCNQRHGIGSSTTPAAAMEGRGPVRSKAPSARSKGKSPMEGQGPARSKAPLARSKAPSARSKAPSNRSEAPSSSQAPKQSSAANSKRKATSDLNAPKAKRRAPNSTSNTTRGNTINVHGVVVGSQSSSNVNVNVNVSSGSGAARGSNALGTGSKKKYARFRSLLGFQDNV